MASADGLNPKIDCNVHIHMKRLLRSYYMNNDIGNYRRENIAQMCPRCSNFWPNTEIAIRLCSKRSRGKLDAKHKAVDSASLTKSQKCRIKWLKKQTSYLEITCGFCGFRSKVYLDQHVTAKAALRTSQQTLNEPSSDVAPVTSKRKKKRKKDPTAGLKIATSNLKNTNTLSKTGIRNSKCQLSALLQQEALKNTSNQSQSTSLESFLK